MTLWTPSDLAGSTLSAWYKADSLSLSDGDGVASWADSSGNGHTLNQSVGSRQPTFQTNELNGLPVIRYDGSSDILRDGDIAALDVGTDDIWMACVFKSLLGSSVQYVFDKRHQNFGILINTAGTMLLRLGSNTGAPRQTNGNWSRTEFEMVTGSRVSSLCRGFLNGSSMTLPGGTNTDSINNADVFDVGARGPSQQTLDGDIAEILVGGATLSTDDRQKIEGYLAHKWGMAGNLPSDHPYKNAAPAIGSAVRKGFRGLINGGLIQA
jgi:hypothetical protein